MAARGGVFRPRWWHPPAVQDPAGILTYLPPALASVSKTQAADTVTGTITVAVQASVSKTQGADTVSAAATVAVTAQVAKAQAGDTVSAQASVAVQASSSITQAGDTVSATAAVAVQASVAQTQADDTVSGAITVTSEEVPVETPTTAGGDSTPVRHHDPDSWWKSPPKKRRKARDTEEGAPSEAPLSVFDAEQEAIAAMLRDAAAQHAQAITAEIRAQELLDELADDDLTILLLAA